MSRLATLFLAVSLPCAGHGDLLLTDQEIAATLSHGPWPPEVSPDVSNRLSGNPTAIALGKQLFSDPVLSRSGNMSCAACHDQDTGFTDGLPRAQGRVELDRNTPALWNLRFHRWFGWAGGNDNLWAQSLMPIVNPDEMAHDPLSLKSALMSHPSREVYEDLFGPLAVQSPEDALVNVAKSLAAFQETLLTGKTQFDLFRDALADGDGDAAALYPEDAQRGLQLFLGRGNCAFCHTGPLFSNGEFHDAGVPYFLSETRVDTGRFGGLAALRESPYTLAGSFSDDPNKEGAWAVRTVRSSHGDFGIFRVPSLRNVALTAPYMHDGSIADLAGVARHYSELNPERLHSDGEAILKPLTLDDREVADLVAFLETLSE